jgi:hypothetical protein
MPHIVIAVIAAHAAGDVLVVAQVIGFDIAAVVPAAFAFYFRLEMIVALEIGFARFAVIGHRAFFRRHRLNRFAIFGQERVFLQLLLDEFAQLQ